MRVGISCGFKHVGEFFVINKPVLELSRRVRRQE